MADLAEVLQRNVLDPAPAAIEERYPYGKPRFPNADPRAYFDAQTQKNYADEPYDPRNISPGLLMGALAAIRPGSAAGSMRPFNPRAPETPLPKRPEAATSDSGWGQHLYEWLLGRSRNPLAPHEPAAAESGSVLSSPLFWGGLAAGAPTIWKLWGLDKEPWPWQDSAAYPDSNAYSADQKRAGRDAAFAARHMDRALALQNRDIPAYNKIENPVFGEAPPYPDEAMKALEQYRLPGGVGNAPY